MKTHLQMHRDNNHNYGEKLHRMCVVAKEATASC